MKTIPFSIYDNAANACWLTITRYYSMNFTSFFMPYHSHSEIEIMYTAAGQCSVLIGSNDGSGGTYILKEGDYIFIDGTIPHRLLVPKDSSCRVLNLEGLVENRSSIIHLNMLNNDENFNNFRKARRPVFFSHDSENIMRNGIVNLHRLLEKGASEIERDLQFALLLTEIGRHHAGSTFKKQPGAMPVYIKKALAFINDNFDQGIAADDTALASGVSKSHLQRAFQFYTGKTLLETISDLRLKKALFLLENSSLPVVDIATSVGFGSRTYFTELFTRTYNISPARYRKHREGGNIIKGHSADVLNGEKQL